MDWLKDYRDIIRSEIPRLRTAGLSFLGEDDNAMKFMDQQVAFTFSVEPFSESLTVLVKFLSDRHPDDEIYGLHMIMALAVGHSMAELEDKHPQDRASIIAAYVDFIVSHRQSLFGETFPLAQQYKQALATSAVRIQAMFEQSAQSPTKP